MLVGATACALQVTASRHRDPPAAAAAAARTRRALSVTWDAARIAYSRHAIEKAGVGTFRRAVEEGMRAGGGGEPGAAAAEAEAARGGELRGQRGEASRRHGVGWGGLVARLAAGVLAWGGVVERGCRAADARRATSTAAPSSVSLPGPRHHSIRSSSSAVTPTAREHAYRFFSFFKEKGFLYFIAETKVDTNFKVAEQIQ